jgi:hypothetical protein
VEDYGITITEVARQVGVSTSAISKSLGAMLFQLVNNVMPRNARRIEDSAGTKSRNRQALSSYRKNDGFTPAQNLSSSQRMSYVNSKVAEAFLSSASFPAAVTGTLVVIVFLFFPTQLNET